MRSAKRYIRESVKWRRKIARRTIKVIRKRRRKGDTTEQILNYFVHSNLSRTEPRFCPLFKNGQKCHILDSGRLNCLGCYCPHFVVTVKPAADGRKECGGCLVESPSRQWLETPGGLRILDCSLCVIPHQRSQAAKALALLEQEFPPKR